MSAALAVATGGVEEDLAERAGAPESVLEPHESLGTVTLVIFVALVGLSLAMAWGWLKETHSLTLGLGVNGIVILALPDIGGGASLYLRPTGLV
jgi:uncharacterized membrane protein